MGGHGNHGQDTFTIPDYRIYKVSSVPKLQAVEKALAAHGLKDPWLRNEVWRYNPQYFNDAATNWKLLFFRGFKYGFGAFVLTIVGSKVYDKFNTKNHGHAHH